jgi:hypothetical protein
MQSISLLYLSRRIFSESPVQSNRLWSGNRGIVFRFPEGERDYLFSSANHPNQLRGPPSLLLNGYRWYLPGTKHPDRENDHWPPCSVELRMRGVIPPLLRVPSWRTQQRHLYSPNLWYRLKGTVRRGCMVFVSGTRYSACFVISLLNRFL